MTFRRIFSAVILLVFVFLGLYSWNQRTGTLDDMSSKVGLEAVFAVFSPLREARDWVNETWRDYVALTEVRRENKVLQARLELLEAELVKTDEMEAELNRLRDLVGLPLSQQWQSSAAHVLTGRIGPNAVLESLTIDRGYLAGAVPGTPIVTKLGLAGRVLRASAHCANVLLITDPGCRVAVRSQKSRATGILAGGGALNPLEVRFISREEGLAVGEVLVTSGIDGVFPPGIPVARVTDAQSTPYSQFMQVSAEPLVQLHRLEEVLLLEYRGVRLPETPLPEPFLSPEDESDRQEALERAGRK